MKLTHTVLLALLLAVALFFSVCDAQRRPRGGRRGRNGRRRNRPRPRPRPVPLPPQDCGPIPHIEHASALHVPDEGIHYACEPGFRLEGTNVITCIDGRWTVAPRCVRQVCPTPLIVAFANPPQLSASGTVVTYTCLPGHRIVNGNGPTSQTLNCNLALRQWPALPQCEAIPIVVCGAPPSVSNANSQVSGNVATYTCNTGYIRQSGTPSQLTCQNGQWSFSILPACVADPSTTQPPPRCLKAPPCGGSTIMRGEVADSYDVGSSVKYTCITGYRLVGQNDNTKKEIDVKCKSDGTWESVPTCEPVVCGQPVHAVGGNSQVIAAAAVTYNSQYTYKCLNLYHVSSTTPTVATCNADGQWSISPPTCTLKVCPYSALPSLANGSPYMVTANADIPVGTNVTFQCSANYRIAPRSPTETGVLQFITCLENGAFSAFPYSCVYTYPTSCADYFTRDDQLGTTSDGTSVAVSIDTDGAGATATPTMVTCIKTSATQVCTEVAPLTTTGSLTGAATACSTTTTTILDGVTFVPATGTDESTAVCDSSMVQYSLSSTQIAAMLASSQNCQQQVSISCSGIAVDVDTNFLGLQLNGQSGTARGVTGSDIGQTVGAVSSTLVGNSIGNLLAAAAPCDCGVLSSGSCDTGCQCSTVAPLASGADTITIPLTQSQPTYVTYIARIAGDRAAAASATPEISASEFDVTVGNIRCCETVSS